MKTKQELNNEITDLKSEIEDLTQQLNDLQDFYNESCNQLTNNLKEIENLKAEVSLRVDMEDFIFQCKRLNLWNDQLDEFFENYYIFG